MRYILCKIIHVLLVYSTKLGRSLASRERCLNEKIFFQGNGCISALSPVIQAHGQAVLNAARVTFRHLTAGLGMSRMSGLPKASADEDDKRFQQCPRYGTKHTDPKEGTSYSRE